MIIGRRRGGGRNCPGPSIGTAEDERGVGVDVGGRSGTRKTNSAKIVKKGSDAFSPVVSEVQYDGLKMRLTPFRFLFDYALAMASHQAIWVVAPRRRMRTLHIEYLAKGESFGPVLDLWDYGECKESGADHRREQRTGLRNGSATGARGCDCRYGRTGHPERRSGCRETEE